MPAPESGPTMAQKRDAPDLHLVLLAGAIVVGGIVIAILSSGPPATGPLTPADLLQLEMSMESAAERDAAKRARGNSAASTKLLKHEAPVTPKKTESVTVENREYMKEALEAMDDFRRDRYPLTVAPQPINPPPYIPDRIQLLPSEPDLRMKK